MSGEQRLRIRSSPRDPARLPEEDEALGQSFFTQLAASLLRGLPRPALLLLRPAQVDQVDVLDVLRKPADQGHTLLAALCGQEGVECAALIGVLTVRTGPQRGARAAVVFVEWPDNRWWTAWQPMDDSRVLVGEGPIVRAAVDGWPKPGGVGGWFAKARRLDLQLRLTKVEDTVEGETIH